MKYGIVYCVLLSGLLSACGRAPQATVNVPPPKIGEVSLTREYGEQNLKDYSVWLASTIVNSIRSSGFETVASSSLVAQQASPVCGFDRITLTDADDDKVPKIFNTTFKDCKQDRSGYTEVKKGDFQLADSDDDNPESGVRSRATNLIFSYYAAEANPETDPARLSFQNTWDFTVTKSSDEGALAYVLTLIGTKLDTNPVKGTLALAGDYVAKPDGDDNDYDNATIRQAEGELIINGDAAFSVKLTDLSFEDTCQASPVSGSLTIGDLTNTLVVTFTGCETVTYSYNGEAVFAAPAE